MGAEALIATAVIGMGLNIYGDLKQSSAEARNAQNRADLLDLQASETLRRMQENIRRTRISGQKLIGVQQTGFAKAGVDVGSGSPINIMAETTSDIISEIIQLQKGAAFEASGLRREAEGLRRYARDAKRAGIFGAAGKTLLTGAQFSRAMPSTDSAGKLGGTDYGGS